MSSSEEVEEEEKDIPERTEMDGSQGSESQATRSAIGIQIYRLGLGLSVS